MPRQVSSILNPSEFKTALATAKAEYKDAAIAKSVLEKSKITNTMQHEKTMKDIDKHKFSLISAAEKQYKAAEKAETKRAKDANALLDKQLKLVNKVFETKKATLDIIAAQEPPKKTRSKRAPEVMEAPSEQTQLQLVA